MKKILWILASACLSFGIVFGANYALEQRQMPTFDMPIALPCFFIGIFILGIIVYFLTGSRIEDSSVRKLGLWNTVVTYAIEAFCLVVASLVVGKVFGSHAVAAWFAALLVLIAPSAIRINELMHIARAENSKE